MTILLPGWRFILLMQVGCRVRRRLHIDVSARHFFECPTISELTTQLSQVASLPTPDIERISHEKPLPISFGQIAWLVEQVNLQSSAYNVPYVFRLLGQLDVTPWEMRS